MLFRSDQGSAAAGQDHAARLRRFQPSHSVSDDDASGNGVELLVKCRTGIDPISVGSIPDSVFAAAHQNLDKLPHRSESCSRVTYVALIAFLARGTGLAPTRSRSSQVACVHSSITSYGSRRVQLRSGITSQYQIVNPPAITDGQCIRRLHHPAPDSGSTGAA